VHRATKRNADLFGFRDRGLIAPGLRADLNVIDYTRLTLGDLELRQDLPAGGVRLMQGAEGYVATLINGVQTRQFDRDTGARPGRLVRGRP
jgi:N-acyl-D-aspartate/D-glutamate deacylase